MSDWSPPRPTQRQLSVFAVVFTLVVAYSLVVLQQVLLPVVAGFVILTVYLGYRLLVAIEAIAGALRTMATEDENRPEQ